MRIQLVIVTMLVGTALPLTVRAQVPDSAMRAAMASNAAQMNDPVNFVLKHRAELALTDVQVATLETLAAALRDSAGVRRERRMRQMRVNPPSPAMAAVTGWSGEIDESALRAALCEQSANTMEYMLDMARDRRAAAALLTPAQAALLPGLQRDDLIKAIRRP